ncbi:MAG: FCD domain-containing protein [Pseudonocardiaceae bacterium]|nr:FCD domain-containing protein [Pseudonocardiaceae bacterium]
MQDLQPSPDGPAGPGRIELQRYYRGAPSRGRTTDAVTDALREAILDGALSPSSWLREDDIATTFEVSRTPVREALRRLADEGLAVKTAHHGTVVAPMSFDDILALYVVRENLEGLAARLAAVRRPSGVVESLHAVHQRMVKAVKRADTPEMVKQNLEFHRQFRMAAGNPYLERFLTQVEHAVRRLPASTYAHPGRPDTALDEHQAIMDAITSGDGDAAERAAKRHMQQARSVRLTVLLGE